MKIETMDIEDKRSDAIIAWARNPSNIISVLPNVVGIENNVVKLKFTRFLLFSFEGEFVVEPSFIGSGIVEYKLTDKKGNEIKIIISAEGKSGVKLSVSYSGEKEWIVGKGLHKILEEISNGIKSELSKLPEVEQQTVGSKNFSLSLSKISSISKLIMKSKLAKTEDITLKEGEVLSYVEGIISDFANYPLIYISGSGSSTFRLLFLNGELKGIYILKDGKDSFNEDDLNHISGEFKIHVYVGISPRIVEVLEQER